MVVAGSSAALAQSDWKLESKDGESWIKFGVLGQARAESADTADGSDTSKDLYFRRLRLLIGAQFSSKWSMFIETDSPNLGKGNDNGTKNEGDIYIQDAVFTYTHSGALKVDAGMILVPFSHNSTQSAGSLLPIDYGAYSFLQSGPTTSRVGRDYGLQVWGHVAKDKLEYRAAVLQGARGDNSTNSFRYAGRLVFNVFEPDKGRFYTGTSLGTKKMLAIGVGVDSQEDYDGFAADLFWDQPWGEKNSFTVQIDYNSLDGGGFIALDKQDVLYGEVGLYFGGSGLQPYVTYGDRNFDDDGLDDETRLEVGLGWYLKGHQRVLKLGWATLDRDQGVDQDQIVLQLQVFKF